MCNTGFLTKVILPYGILNKEQANILLQECTKARVSPEFFMVCTGVLDKESILKLNDLKDGKIEIPANNVRNLFDINLLNSEIEKIKLNGIKIKNCYEPEIGEKVNRFIIKEYMGKNALFKVYRAIDTENGINVTLKILASQLIIDDITIQKRFIEEARKNQVLRHPGVVRVIDANQTEKFTYVATEYIKSDSLNEFIKKEKAFDIIDIVKIALEISKTLEYAYTNKNLVHRDLSSENIRITEDGKIKLTDFGLTRIIREPDKYQTISGQIYETPYYMSPEQLMNNDSRDHRSDLYSLGVNLYHLTTGKLPFHSLNLTEVILMHLTKIPVSPCDLVTSKKSTNILFVKKLSAIIMKLIEKDINIRYQNYDEVISDLNKIKNEYLDLVILNNKPEVKVLETV